MATKIAAAHQRMFKNVFVCKDCSQRIRSDPIRIILKKVTCRRCNGHSFRPVKVKKK